MKTSLLQNTCRHTENKAGVIQFPHASRPKSQKQAAWICNVSKQYVFSQQHHEYLQIASSAQYSQFELMCRLLEANTCRVIYFDETLNAEQLALLREKQDSSRTELIHAKLAYLFATDVSSISA